MLGNWSSPLHTIAAETKAGALDEIERALSARPVDELAEWELVAIAEAIRDKHYRPVMEAQDESRRLADVEHEHTRRTIDQQSGEKRARERHQTRLAELVEYGTYFARKALRDVDDLALHERLAIMRRVEHELEQALRGKRVRTSDRGVRRSNF